MRGWRLSGHRPSTPLPSLLLPPLPSLLLPPLPSLLLPPLQVARGSGAFGMAHRAHELFQSCLALPAELFQSIVGGAAKA